MVEFCNKPEVFGTEEDFHKGKQLRISYLPVIHRMMNGKTFLYRNYEKADDHKIYDLIVKCASTDAGYSIDEYPSLNCFRNYDLLDSYCAVLEDIQMGEIVGFIIFGSSRLLRSAENTLLGDIAVYVEPKYRGSGFGTEITVIAHGMMKDMGFQATLSEIFISNIGTVVLSQGTGLTFVGFSPKCVHTKALGWIDCAYLFRDLINAKGFHEEIYQPVPLEKMKLRTSRL